MSRQFWQEEIVWATASGAAVANTTTETSLFPNVTIPANYLQDGRTIKITLTGGYGTTGTPTLQFKVKWGSTILAASGAIVTGSGVGGGASMTAIWVATILLQVRSNGSSGTALTQGLVHLGSTGVAAMSDYPVASGSTGGTTPVAQTADFTADTALTVSVTWGTANAANSIQGHQMAVESLN